MAALPGNMDHGTVTGDLISALQLDSPSSDIDAKTISGAVIFTPAAKVIRNQSAKKVILPASVRAELVDGAFTVRLIATDDPDLNPTDWTYMVQFALSDGLKVDPFNIEVPAGSEQDISSLIPVKVSQGTTFLAGPPGESGVDYAPVVTLTNPTMIPTDVAGRLDLVFTQPTTVWFDSPGRTDLVISIEGWNHIEWEGVVVHGMPDVNGVVWLSAMWRDRDSSWHLLCEQDVSSGGGGGTSIKTIEVPALTFGPVGWAKHVGETGLGLSSPEPPRTIDEFGRVLHEVAPMPQIIVDVAPSYATATTRYGLRNIVDGTAMRKELINIGATAALSNQERLLWSEAAVAYDNKAYILGMFCFEYGTISQPGGEGFRVTIKAIEMNPDGFRVAYDIEVTDNPISFGEPFPTVSTTVSSGLIPDLHPDFFWQVNAYITFPWGEGNGGDPAGQGFQLQIGDATGTPSSTKILLGMSAQAFENNPLPGPAVVDEDGFAIHRYTGNVSADPTEQPDQYWKPKIWNAP